MVCIWLGNFTAYFNETTATTAMHTIGADFGDSQNQNWIATAYLLGFTVTQTLLGRFSDIFGRSQVFNGTMFIFAVGTLWCASAQSMISLIGARVLQGIGAAGRQSVAVIVILDLTTSDTRGLWLGFLNMSSAIGLAIGPVLGAIFSVDTNWRWIFWTTLILIGITMLVALTAMRYPVPHRKQSVGLLGQLREVDYIGCILAVAISSMICVAIELGNKIFPWNSAPIIVLFILGGLLIPVFACYELKVAKQPVVDMHLFSIPNIPVTCLINFLTGAGYFGAVFFLPRYFIDVKGSSLVTSGLQMFGLILTLGVSSVVGANILSQTGQVRLIGAVGGALYALGSGLMFIVGRDTPASQTIGISVITGVASGLLYQPSLVVGPMSVQPHQVAGISGFLSFLRTLGGTFATALLTAVFETGFTTALERSLIDQGLGLADDAAAGMWPQYEDEIMSALVRAYHFGTIPAVCFGVIYAIAVLFLKRVDFVPAWKRKRLQILGSKAQELSLSPWFKTPASNVRSEVG
ncbi:major facilitator superfamily domain-containing protein [Pisolithus orientalis]|uniref:major facilitator superfamily domain-containing protein n=1 Tax=Pisolithus orientalis TaxID=936130 RepID=UPI0022255BD8|nr:major facilitator superfamily domain-containing protein [Pisolithus orientalis]KAI6019870.1 major facilitator superfamily domain-containing protein [Pisolithus orientalis]